MDRHGGQARLAMTWRTNPDRTAFTLGSRKEGIPIWRWRSKRCCDTKEGGALRNLGRCIRSRQDL
jgi:hypothetical protein